MAKKGAGTSEYTNPNLIPMIDIMFLLLLFFMLGADMGQREKEELILANADKVKEEDKTRDLHVPLTTINIHHDPGKGVACPQADNGGICRDASHWKWAISGHDYNKDTI